MPRTNHQSSQASTVAELTFQLLVLCQEKEMRMAEEFGISHPEFRTMRLFAGERSIQQKTLTRRVGLSGGRLTRILDQLQSRKLIVRKEDPRDRRESVISLTERGMGLCRKLEERHVQIHQEILRDFPESLQPALSEGLTNMVRAISGWLDRGKSSSE